MGGVLAAATERDVPAPRQRYSLGDQLPAPFGLDQVEAASRVAFDPLRDRGDKFAGMPKRFLL